MSTYYAIICNSHKERCRCVSKSAGGVGPYGDGLQTLWSFLFSHAGCDLKVVSEHQPEWDSDDFTGWSAENYKELREIDRSSAGA